MSQTVRAHVRACVCTKERVRFVRSHVCFLDFKDKRGVNNTEFVHPEPFCVLPLLEDSNHFEWDSYIFTPGHMSTEGNKVFRHHEVIPDDWLCNGGLARLRVHSCTEQAHREKTTLAR